MVRDGERPTAHVGGRQHPRPPSVRKLLEPCGNSRKREMLGLLDDGHHQPLVAKRCADANVDVVEDLQVIFVPAAVDLRHISHGGDGGGNDIGCIGQVDPVGGEFCLVSVTMPHDGAEIRLEYRRDMRGGTFTISNHGVSGSLVAAPIIINQPQSAILGVGKLEKRVVVREVDGADAIQIRPMAYVSLTIDHRALDGHQTNTWLMHFVRALETWPL